MARVLVVDDESKVTDLWSMTLKLHGYNFDVVNDGQDALNRLANRDVFYDVMLLDLVMPDPDGEKVLSKYYELSPLTAVIVITAHSTESRAITALKHGAVDYLKKPLNLPDDLIKTVDRYVRRFEAQNFTVDIESRQVFYEGKEIDFMTPTGFDIFSLFIRWPRRKLTILQIAHALGEGKKTEEEAHSWLHTQIGNLRRQLRQHIGREVIAYNPNEKVYYLISSLL